MTAIIDTNVILVANGQHEGVGPDCVIECTKRLQVIMARGRIAIDDAFEILREYQNKTQPKTDKRPGNAFVKWALQNNANDQRCDQIAITPDEEREFEEFPDDARLEDFDTPDRKFVAVAITHPEHPPILQAADANWLKWAPALNDHGVTVDFLCNADISTFRKAQTKNE